MSAACESDYAAGRARGGSGDRYTPARAERKLAHDTVHVANSIGRNPTADPIERSFLTDSISIVMTQ